MDPRLLKEREIQGSPYARPAQLSKSASGATARQAASSEHPPLTERKFLAETLRRFQSQGWLCYHTLDSRGSQPGFPDLVCVHPTRGILYLELKTARGRLSNDQERWLDTITLAGGNAALLRPSDLSPDGCIDQMAAGTWQWTSPNTPPAQ